MLDKEKTKPIYKPSPAALMDTLKEVSKKYIEFDYCH